MDEAKTGTRSPVIGAAVVLFATALAAGIYAEVAFPSGSDLSNGSAVSTVSTDDAAATACDTLNGIVASSHAGAASDLDVYHSIKSVRTAGVGSTVSVIHDDAEALQDAGTAVPLDGDALADAVGTMLDDCDSVIGR
jgi:hypothetical protein